jgi:hypothetical protein
MEENLHNITLQEDETRFEIVVSKHEEYISRGAQVKYRLQWIQKGIEGSKFFLDLLKRKVVFDKVLGLCIEDGTLEEKPLEI